MGRYLNNIALMIFVLFSVPSLACDVSAGRRHLNPDGSIGGMVSRNARVHSEAFVGFDAKVCDVAVVEGGAKIVNQAIVKDKSFIKRFSVIKDRAIVSGGSLVWGRSGREAIVGGKSRVFGSSRILYGTKIEDNALIYGAVSLYDTKVIGDSKVCQGYTLRNMVVNDNFFCENTNELSRVSFHFDNLDTKSLNSKSTLIRISSLNGGFNHDKNQFRISINNNILDQHKFTLLKNQILIDAKSELLEGQNSISVLGLDEFGKRIQNEDYEFLAGSQTKEISLQSDAQFEDLQISAEFVFDGQKYKSPAKIVGSQLILKNIPANVPDEGVVLRGIGRNNFFFESYETFENIPNSLTLYSYPLFQNNNSDFSQGFVGWKLSHPENATIKDENGYQIAELIGDSFERVEISKTYRLLKTDTAISLNTVMPDLSSLFKDQPITTVEVAIINVENRSLYHQKYFLGLNGSKKKNDSFQNLTPGEYVIYLRINPSESSRYPFEPLKIASAGKTDHFLQFIPYHLNVLNKRSEILPSTSDPECDDPEFNVNNNTLFNYLYNPAKPEEIMINNDFRFLSMGTTGAMSPEVTTNRVFGRYIYYTNLQDYHVTEAPTLLLVQNGIVKDEISTSKCVGLDIATSDSKDFYDQKTNLSRYMFEIPLTTNLAISTIPGSRISLFLKAKISNGQETFYKVSNEIEVPIIVASSLPRDFWYGVVPPKGLDHYDNNSATMLRTGGDKWILPFYSSVLHNMVSLSPGLWKINDLSKLNGGDFPGHKSHSDGTDADISADGFRLGDNDSADQGSEPDWTTILQKIDQFLIYNSGSYDLIKTFFITRYKNPSAVAPWAYDSKFIDSQFRNRCYGTDPTRKRYVSFDQEDVHKSLLQHYSGHWNHLHLKFISVNSITGRPVTNPNTEVEFGLEDFWYRIVEKEVEGVIVKTIQIDPKVESEFPKSYAVLWRLQGEQSFGGFNEFIHFGRWPESVTQRGQFVNVMDNIIENKDLFLYLTIADLKSGNCVQRDLKIDASFLSKSPKKWTYVKSKMGYLIEL